MNDDDEGGKCCNDHASDEPGIERSYFPGITFSDICDGDPTDEGERIPAPDVLDG